MTRRVLRTLAALASLAVVVLTASPGFAAATLTVSQTTGLTDGQSVTISGSGFTPNLGDIAIGQCVEGAAGPADCNTLGGATFKNADASGNVASFTIVVKEVFGSHDCSKVQCVIAGQPLPTNADAATVKANTWSTDISFGAAEAATTAPTATTTTAATTTTETTETTETADPLPKTGAGDSVPVLMLGATALLAGGLGVMLLVPGRRRGEQA